VLLIRPIIGLNKSMQDEGKLMFFGVNDPARQNFANLRKRQDADTNSRFMFKFQGNRPPGSAPNDASLS